MRCVHILVTHALFVPVFDSLCSESTCASSPQKRHVADMAESNMDLSELNQSELAAKFLLGHTNRTK